MLLDVNQVQMYCTNVRPYLSRNGVFVVESTLDT